MAATGVDVYLTASQKAIGAPPGLALSVFSQDALAARRALSTPPPLGLDLDSWQPIMTAYEAGQPSYFATPATSLIAAVAVALDELVAEGVGTSWARHARVADELRASWSDMGLELLVESPAIAANTLSAIRYPRGMGPELVGRIKANGVICAGGLHPKLKAEYFRVGHMGWVTTQPALLAHTVAAVKAAL
jgi:alanine-glyoxylate transaminase/serine-glyoxylate transaminase/serine-pyruvate transaminase